MLELLNDIKAEIVELLKKFQALPASRKISIGMFFAMLAFFLISHFFYLREIKSSWDRPEYEWGFVIPFLALIVLWVKRQPIYESQFYEQLLGVGMILACTLIRYVLWQRYGMQQFAYYSLIGCTTGLVLILGGIRMLSWTWPALLLLTLSLPFSQKMEFTIFGGLQRIATKCSVFSLETIGVDVTSSGNNINLRRDGELIPLNVAEGCAGFKGTLTALSLTMTVVFLIRAELWLKLILVASSVPIALFGNTLRIVIQCLCYQISDSAGLFFHDYAAQFIVYPFVFGLLYLEYVVLRNLVIEDTHQTVAPIDRVSPMRLKLPQPR